MLSEKFVLGIDLGTSSVKVMALSKTGKIFSESSSIKDLTNSKGYSEENPNEWYQQAVKAIDKLKFEDGISLRDVQGISFSGQMHGLVLLDAKGNVLCNSILWNDTRSFKEVSEINNTLGREKILKITGNRMVEAYLLPKLLWIKNNNFEVWKKINTIMLPKDYLKYRITGVIDTDFSDATGTGLFDIAKRTWSAELLNMYDIKREWLPKLSESVDVVGHVNQSFHLDTGVPVTTVVTSGAADNAAGALGAGVTQHNKLLTSIGTSGVVLKPEKSLTGADGTLQSEYSAIKDCYYSMGVTLAAGHSFDWLKRTFFSKRTFDEITSMASKSPIGSNGLKFAPYISGERTPHFDAKIRGSFTNISDINNESDFIRSVMEGITFSLKEIVDIYIQKDSEVREIVSIGGGSHSELWLQMQADIFSLPIKTLRSEQGPSLGASLLASVAVGWFDTLEIAVKRIVNYNSKMYYPQNDISDQYQIIFDQYKKIYDCTKQLEQ